MPSARATINDITLAESSETIIVEGNHYFPSSVKKDLFTDSKTTTHCPWKGDASYYNLENGGNTVKDVAWYYPQAGSKAKNIENYVAFYKSKVSVTET